VKSKTFSLFKKKKKITKKEVTAIEMGSVLFRLITDSENRNQNIIELLQDADDTIKQQVLKEMLFLRVFAIDTAVTNVLGETPIRDGVLSTFYNHVKRLTDLSDESLWKDLELRLFSYEEAFKTPHHRGPAFQIGKAFSSFCGYEMDAVVMLAGGAEFTSTATTASDLLKSFQIKE
jgi:hypothetical protein